MIRYVFVFLAVLLTGTALHAAQASAQVLEPRFEKAKNFAQVYTYTAQFGDTLFLQMQFSLTNLGISSQNAATKILLMDKRTGPQCWNMKYVRKGWSYDGGFPQSLQIGSNRIEIQNDKTLISARNDEITVGVTFDRVPVPIVTPNTNYAGRDGFFEYAVLIPWTGVRAVIEQAGGSRRQLTGYGMLETSRSTLFPSDFCRGWLNFRGYGANASFAANLRLPKGDTIPAYGWVWENSGQAPRSITGFPVAFEGSAKDRNGFVVRHVTAPDNSFSIEPRTLLYRYSFIDELGPVLGAIVKLVIGDLVFYYYEADAHIAGSAGPIPGILECMRIE